MKLKKNENNIPKYCKSATHKNFIKNCFNGNNIPKNKAKGLGHVQKMDQICIAKVYKCCFSFVFDFDF